MNEYNIIDYASRQDAAVVRLDTAVNEQFGGKRLADADHPKGFARPAPAQPDPASYSLVDALTALEVILNVCEDPAPSAAEKVETIWRISRGELYPEVTVEVSQ